MRDAHDVTHIRLQHVNEAEKAVQESQKENKTKTYASRAGKRMGVLRGVYVVYQVNALILL